ncbi:MAG: phosphoribosylamine--glycine ligase, partial [Ignavibacteria bacterium]|nr:phosphoribosylamine--glycine ligase [Ignavibacteria bacterium]
MKVAVIGSGGREDALCWKISKSPNLKKLFAIPGNPGTERYCINIPIDVNDYKSIISFCKEESIDLVVIGPEAPLVGGLSNLLRDNGMNVFGPNKFPAQLEGSKVFAKNLMQKYNIPTAAYHTFTLTEYEKAVEHLKISNFPIVVKADGLAAGKGVSICNDFDSAKQIINQIFVEKKFGDSGNKIVIEEFLNGEEVSVFVVTDGTNYTLLTPAQDYKKIFDGDKGKNTGGMGSFSFKQILSDEQIQEVDQKIVRPTLNAIKLESEPYVGCLYCGLILTNDGIKVIEFNCRFGDPEIQAVVMTIDEDFLSLLYETAKGELK